MKKVDGFLLRIAASAMLLLVAACSPSPSEKLPESGLQGPVESLATETDSVFEALEDIDRGDRENWQKPQMVISRLGDLSDKVVADIGAGTGYFSMPLARKAKKVIAIDIEQQFLDYINRRLSRTPDRKALNLETRLTEPEDPSLYPSEADLVIMVNTYPFIQNRVKYFKKVWEGLKPQGKLVVIDFKKEPLPVGPPVEGKVHPRQIQAELDSAGFDLQQIDTTSLDYQFTISLQKRVNNP
jgi:ubiquinone/menaquinone biosynthesis C-methylase UbiE